MDGKRYVSLEEQEEYNSIVNQTFHAEEEFFNFYNSYAESKGFSVRKDKLRYRPGSEQVISRRFCCSFEGYRSMKRFDRPDKKREPKDLTRCGCKAKLDMKLNLESGLWFVSDFNDIHNHDLVAPQHVFILRSHRGLSAVQEIEAIELGLGGLRTCQIMDVMDKNYGGAAGFILRDLYNFFARKKKKSVEGFDAEYVLNYMHERQENDLDFYFTYCTDEERRLKNIFWSDARSQMDYQVFGDVVVFDSTYRVNKYNLPFVPFVGVNHHRSTVVFGCGIISDESVSSYEWLLKALLEAMQQKHPLSLITDGDYAMARAIQKVMPFTDHRLCCWHIERNMASKLCGKKLNDFRKFIYDATDVDEFERNWLQFKERHNVTDKDIWIMRMYELRKKWSAAYTKGRRFLGMKSNQRSESLNSKLHNKLDRRMSLVDLVEHYESCVSGIRKNELVLNAEAAVGVKYTDIAADVLEKKAARIFTRPMFLKVKDEIRAVCKWEVAEVVVVDNVAGTYEFVLKSKSDKRLRVACRFDGSSMLTAACSCRMMESEAFPCAHLFCVMKYVNLDNIPLCCINRRWTKQAKSGLPLDVDSKAQVWAENGTISGPS